MWNLLDDITFEERDEIFRSDDKEQFLPMLSEFGDTVKTVRTLLFCAREHAKKCLLAMIQGEVCAPAHQIYARLAPDHNPLIPTPLACVVTLFPEADDIVDLLLKQGPVDHANIKCHVGDMAYALLETRIAYPLDHVLVKLSYKSHLRPWSSGASLSKLIMLLCQWESKPNLNCARLLAPHTDGINDIAWSFVKEGKLVPLAALLLVAQEKVLAPFDSGLTIPHRIMDMLHKLSLEDDLDYEGAMYHSMLIEACKLFDIFKRAGAALSLYCSSMHEHVPPHKVLIDVARILKHAGYALEPRDLDLRDCYRDCPELRKATMCKLSDPGSPSNNYSLLVSLTPAHGFSTTVLSYPLPGNCQLFHKLKSGPVNLKPSASKPRLYSTAADQVTQVENGVSGITRKNLAYIAFKLKRGVKF